ESDRRRAWLHGLRPRAIPLVPARGRAERANARRDRDARQRDAVGVASRRESFKDTQGSDLVMWTAYPNHPNQQTGFAYRDVPPPVPPRKTNTLAIALIVSLGGIIVLVLAGALGFGFWRGFMNAKATSECAASSGPGRIAQCEMSCKRGVGKSCENL